MLYVIVAGSSLNLSCAAEGSPPPRYTWTLNGDTVKEESEDGTIIIEDVSQDLSGELRCTASNSEGEDESSTELVVVRGTRLGADTADSAAISANAGDSLQLLCPVEADPAVRDTVTRRWYKDGAEVGEELLEGDSVHISYLVTENTGEYRWVSVISGSF